jgi:hypothetical protein
MQRPVKAAQRIVVIDQIDDFRCSVVALAFFAPEWLTAE